MLIGARMGVWSSGGEIIPTGWVEVEYLHKNNTSSGGPFIDTGVNGNKVGEYEISFVLGNTPSSACVIFAGDSNSECGKIYYSSIGRVSRIQQYGMSSNQFDLFAANVKTDVSYRNGRIIANRSDVGRYVDGTWGNLSWYLFGGHGELNISNANIKIFYARMFSDGVIVRDFIPVRNIITNEGAMCDLLTGEIYHNVGTGLFDCGPAVDKARFGIQ